jgi:hypothetical protein
MDLAIPLRHLLGPPPRHPQPPVFTPYEPDPADPIDQFMAVQAPSVRRHRVLFDMKMLCYNYELASNAANLSLTAILGNTVNELPSNTAEMESHTSTLIECSAALPQYVPRFQSLCTQYQTLSVDIRTKRAEIVAWRAETEEPYRTFWAGGAGGAAWAETAPSPRSEEQVAPAQKAHRAVSFDLEKGRRPGAMALGQPIHHQQQQMNPRTAQEQPQVDLPDPPLMDHAGADTAAAFAAQITSNPFRGRFRSPQVAPLQTVDTCDGTKWQQSTEVRILDTIAEMPPGRVPVVAPSHQYTSGDTQHGHGPASSSS